MHRDVAIAPHSFIHLLKTYLLYNNQLLTEENFALKPLNRSFQYNDGLFETLLLDKNQIRFLGDHLRRLRKALKVLKMKEPVLTKNPQRLTAKILELTSLNGLEGSVRIKCKVWRAGQGLYTPERLDSEMLVTVQPPVAHPPNINKAGFCEGIRNRLTPFSFFKGPYSLHYVMAALERKEKQLEEIILLDEKGYVSECGISNIFWVRENILFTPSLQTGCINGVMRTNVQRACKAGNIQLKTGFFKPNEMLAAEIIFTSNITGLYPVLNVNDHLFPPSHPLLTELASRLL